MPSKKTVLFIYLLVLQLLTLIPLFYIYFGVLTAVAMSFDGGYSNILIIIDLLVLLTPGTLFILSVFYSWKKWSHNQLQFFHRWVIFNWVCVLLALYNFYTDIPIFHRVSHQINRCSIMCYSHENDLHHISSAIYSKGEFIVNGAYSNNTCIPADAIGKDISSMIEYKNLCQQKVSACVKGNCWAGGNTR